MKIGSVLTRGGGAGTSATIAEGSASEGAEAGFVDRALAGFVDLHVLVNSVCKVIDRVFGWIGVDELVPFLYVYHVSGFAVLKVFALVPLQALQGSGFCELFLEDSMAEGFQICMWGLNTYKHISV